MTLKKLSYNVKQFRLALSDFLHLKSFYTYTLDEYFNSTEVLDFLHSINVFFPPRWCFHLIVVRRFEYASDPESYTSGSVATGRASLAGQVEG